MTREIAIRRVQHIIGYFNYRVGEDVEALNMAIEVLTKIEAIQKIIDMPFEWEQDDRRRYAKIVDIVRKDLEQENDKWNIPSAYSSHSILWEDNPDKRYS